jgi:hypothetical protein
MVTAGILLFALAGTARDEPTPHELLAKLGSEQFAVGLEAALSLRRLGDDALPPLRDARDTGNPAARRRAAAVIEAIERQRLMRPTLIRLDFRDRLLTEVVGEVARRTGWAVALEPGDERAWSERRLNLQAREPVPFWEALDRIGQAGGVRHNPSPPGDRERVGPPRVVLIAGDGGRIPVAYVGPLRFNVVALSRHRNVTTGPGAAARAVEESFTALIQVFAEPGLVIDGRGPIRVLEAVDDRGQDLRPVPEPKPEGPAQPHPALVVVSSGFSDTRFDFGGPGIIQQRVPLRLPTESARRIGRLRCEVPLTARARTGETFAVPLEGAEGRTFSGLGVTLRISEITRDGPTTSIRLDVRRDEPAEEAILAGLRQDGLVPYQSHSPLEDHLELRDAKGQTCWPNVSPIQAEDRTETRLIIYAGDHVGPPVELRYHGVVGARTEVSFEFNDLPLP